MCSHNADLHQLNRLQHAPIRRRPTIALKTEADRATTAIAALDQRQRVARQLCVRELHCECEPTLIFGQQQGSALGAAKQRAWVVINQTQNIGTGFERRAERAGRYALNERAYSRVGVEHARVTRELAACRVGAKLTSERAA